VSIALLGVTHTAHAQDESLAEALYREGQKLIAQGNVHEACLKFAESERVDAATGTLLATAACHEKEGKVATAWAEYSDVIVMAQRSKEPERERYARTRAAALETQVFRVTLDLPSPPPGTEVTVDARVLGVGVFGTALPLDPGEHRFEVIAPGKSRWTKVFTVPNAAGNPHLVVTLVPMGTTTVATASPGATPWIVTGAAGLAAVITGGVLWGVAAEKGSTAVSDARAATNGAAYANATSEHDSALRLQAAGIVVGGLGLAATALGGVMLGKAWSRGPADGGVHASVRLGPSSLAVVGSF
jgi:hypothetical protein